MKEHKHATLLRITADNEDQLFECQNFVGTIFSFLLAPNAEWKPTINKVAGKIKLKVNDE